MKGGDISNVTSPRLIVVIDVVVKSEMHEKKRMLLPSTMERKVIGYDNLALSHLWNVANKFGLSVELAAFADEEWSQAQVDRLMERLDRRGANPFNYGELYDSKDELISDLPYRQNLAGIIDIPGQVARFGSKGVELYNL